MSLKIEFAIAGLALFGLGAFYASQKSAAVEVRPEATLEQFTATDFDAFDRHFEMDGETCAVGFKEHRMCFGTSPYEHDLVIGEALPASIPVLSAEFRVIVETDLKAGHLQTARFGRTLVLVDTKTHTVRDILRLDARTFARARGPVPTRNT